MPMSRKGLAITLYELGNLSRVSRSGLYQFLYEDFESIAEHSYKVALIAYFLGKQLKADTSKILLIALFHDCAETRTGDGNWIQKPYIKTDEAAAIRDQLGLVGKDGEEAIKAVGEYKTRDTVEAKIVKDADYIEYFMSLKILEMKGNKEATKRIGYETADLKFMYTKEGKALLKSVLATDPDEWTRVAHNQTMKEYKKKVK